MIHKVRAVVFILFIIILFSFGATYISKTIYLQGSWVSIIHDGIQHIFQFLGMNESRSDEFSVYSISIAFFIIIVLVYKIGGYIFSKSERE